MARAIDVREFTPCNSRDDLIHKVKQAPVEHAEAILAAYDLLQRLHEKGVIDLFNGLLSAGDTVVERVTDVIGSKEAMITLRLVLTLGSLVTSIDPEKTHSVISEAEKDEPPSLISIVKQATSKDARRSLATIVGLLNVLGAALNTQPNKR